MENLFRFFVCAGPYTKRYSAWKYAAKAAHGPRGEQGEIFSARFRNMYRNEEFMEKEPKPVLKKENLKPLFESIFIKVFDLQYGENQHYFNATRRPLGRIAATKSDEEFLSLIHI